jgi:pyridinium-3,5-bisthiocarboxylic acid mononucleotide nickel chelatase
MQMKKNRPGTLVTVICAPDRTGEFSDFLMRETTTIGLRWRIDNRIKAHRSIMEVLTKYGPVQVKIAEVNGSRINVTPEYEDCKRLALEKKIPLKEIMEQARIAAGDAFRSPDR